MPVRKPSRRYTRLSVRASVWEAPGKGKRGEGVAMASQGASDLEIVQNFSDVTFISGAAQLNRSCVLGYIMKQ
jgi:hypothetical protein